MLVAFEGAVQGHQHGLVAHQVGAHVGALDAFGAETGQPYHHWPAASRRLAFRNAERSEAGVLGLGRVVLLGGLQQLLVGRVFLHRLQFVVFLEDHRLPEAALTRLVEVLRGQFRAVHGRQRGSGLVRGEGVLRVQAGGGQIEGQGAGIVVVLALFLVTGIHELGRGGVVEVQVGHGGHALPAALVHGLVGGFVGVGTGGGEAEAGQQAEGAEMQAGSCQQ
ncbi:hypothetical protein D3C79_711070 [compost metagenome]